MFTYFREKGFFPYVAVTAAVVFAFFFLSTFLPNLYRDTEFLWSDYLTWRLPWDIPLAIGIAIFAWYFPAGQSMIHRSKAVTTLDLNDPKNDQNETDR